jgi:hypothetical protein
MKMMDCRFSFFDAGFLKYVILPFKEAPCQTRYRLWWTTDPLCSGRLPNLATSSQVPSPMQPGAVAVPPAIAKPNDPGHGPHFQLTQKVDGKTVTQNLPSPAAVRKAESEIAEFRRFQTLTGELVDVNRKICRLRPVEQAVQTAQEKKRRRQSNKKLPVK